MDDAEEPATALPPPPAPWNIPNELVARWVDLPTDKPLTFGVTRAMLDNLFFALHQLTLTHAHLDVALVAYSNGDLEGANSRLLQGRQSNIDALSHARHMMADFMAAAQVIPDE